MAFSNLYAHSADGKVILFYRRTSGTGTISADYTLDSLGNSGWINFSSTIPSGAVSAVLIKSNSSSTPYWFRMKDNVEGIYYYSPSAFPGYAFNAKFQDFSGWTIIPAASDTMTVFCSQSYGNNSNDGLSVQNPVKDPVVGYNLLRPNTFYPDQLLLCRGDVWNGYTDIGNGGYLAPRNYWGRSENSPFVIADYGSGDRPQIRFNSDLSGGGTAIWGRDLDNFFMRSIILTPHNRAHDNGGLFFTADNKFSTSMHFEDMDFSGGTGVAIEPRVSGVQASDVDDFYLTGNEANIIEFHVRNVVLRRCSVENTFNDDSVGGGHCQGIYIDSAKNEDPNIDGILIEECVADHNGWSEGPVSGEATPYNHNFYVTGHCGRMTYRRNISARASATGLQHRPGGHLVQNLFLKNPLGIWMADPSGHMLNVASGNVIINGMNIGDLPSFPRGYAINLDHLRNADIHDNIATMNTSATVYPVCLNVTAGITSIAERVIGGISSVLVRNNIFYKWNGPFTLVPNGPFNDFSCVGNDFQQSTLDNNKWVIFQDAYNFSAPLFFSGNRYWSPNVNTGGGTDYWVYTPSGFLSSIYAWNTLVGDTTSSGIQVTYPDPDRTIETYMASIGETPTLDAFLTRARQNCRGNWDTRFTALPVINYIREGFGLAPLDSNGTPTSDVRVYRIMYNGNKIYIDSNGKVLFLTYN